ncbi:MAG TPA: type VI secretion system accessory protein TagJ [Bryobacteraceae bacterium]|nr:type VI secretion system accessory protein TagJ [Bryobacteraceae bacterium]
MNSRELYQAGKLDEAVQALGSELRNDPTDLKRRTFLFELLCFTGEYDRAEKQLDILADAGKEAAMGTLLYRSALQAARTRRDMFEKKTFPLGAEGALVGGTLNGQAFESIEDADPRIGARLEVFAAGAYLWLPFEHIASVRMEPPKRLRDTIWIPAILQTGPKCKGLDLGEVLLPVLTPLVEKHPQNSVRLGRETVWEEADGETVPAGQKLLLVDGEEIPILEVRNLLFAASSAAAE